MKTLSRSTQLGPTGTTDLASGISVVIPAYKSEESIGLLVERLLPVLETLADAFEIIIVNDGCRDGTWDKIRALSDTHDTVRGILLMRNYGQHNALLCGIRAAQYDVTVTMDDDLQHPPELLPSLIEALDESTDVVYGTPDRQQHGVLRNLASRITKMALQNAMGAETAKNVAAWRAFRTGLRGAFDTYRSSFVSIDVLLTWGTSRFRAVRVRHEPRQYGKSNYTLGKLVTHSFNMMTGFSTLPLQFATFIGFLLTGFGALVFMWVIGLRLFGANSPSGFPFLACIIAIFSGAQLLCLGIIGEYLGRIHFRLLERPSYVIEVVEETPPPHG